MKSIQDYSEPAERKLEQTSSQTKSTAPLEIQVSEKMAMLFIRMASIYGHLWSSQYKSLSQLRLAQIEWGEDLNDYTMEKIEKAIRRCKKEYRKPPNLPEFKSLFVYTQLQALSDPDRADEKQLEKLETDEEKATRMARGKAELDKLRAGLPEKYKPSKLTAEEEEELIQERLDNPAFTMPAEMEKAQREEYIAKATGQK